MKTKHFFPSGCLIPVTFSLIGARICAAPLAWFPGPALEPQSGAATVVSSGRGNVLIGGDAYAYYYYPLTYPLSLVATNSAWTYLSPLYSLNIAPGAVASGGMIILYGGTDGTSSTNGVLGYSPSGDPVQTLAPMSVARAYLGYAPDSSGNAYAIGGLDDTGQPLASVERYNSDANTWAPVASLPAPRYDFPAVFNRTNLIYIFGGRTDTSGTETASVLRYSVRSNTWTALAPMPTAVAGSAAALGVDGKIYVVGGVSGGVTLSAVQVYDPAANSWAISTPLPEALSASAMGVDSLGRLLLMGGMDATGTDVGDVWRSQQMGVPDAAPVLTQYPATNGAYLTPYVSSIAATGAPPPVYVLLNGPTGMEVDYYSGAVTWTPQADQIGSNPVTIRATNYAGVVDWNFAINVPYPRPVAPTNLAVVSVTDNSVTITWDPESPVYGPLTYSANLRHVLHSPKGSGATVWYTRIGGTAAQPPLTIGGLTPGLSQAYYIVATGPGGSSPSNAAAIVAATTGPQGPTNLVVTGLTSTTVSLAWSPSPGPAQNPLYSPITSYTIMERNTSVSPAVNVPTVPNLVTTSGAITGLTPGSSHIWFVSGVDAYGNGSPLGIVYVVVANPVPAPAQVGGGSLLSNGNFQFTVQEGGSVVQTVVIQANTDLANPAGWVQVGSVLPSNATFTFTDPNASQYPSRFYRVLTP